MYVCMYVCMYVYIYICSAPHSRPPPPLQTAYSVFLASDSAKIGSCDIQPLRKSTAKCTNLKLIVSRNSCIYEQSTMYSGCTRQTHAQVSVALMTTNNEAQTDRSYHAHWLRESSDVY